MINIIKNLNKKEILFSIIAILLIILSVWLDLKIPDYMSEITKLVQSGNNNISEVLLKGGIMLLFSFANLLCAFIISYLAAYIGTSFEKNLRKKVFNKVQNFGMEEIKEFKLSSLITRDTNDITQIKMFIVMGIQMLARAPIMAIMALIKISGKEWEFSLITIIGVAIILALSLIVILIAIPKFKKVQKLTDNLNNITRENLTGIRVIRAYNAEDYELNKFENANNDLTDTNMFVQKIMSLIMPTMTAIMSFLSLAIYWVGSYLIDKAGMFDRLTIFSDMVVFSSYSIQVIISFMMLTIIFIIYPRASVSMNRISEVLNKKTNIKYGNINKDISDEKGTIEFKNVSFKYPDAEDYVLKNISFKANKGDVIAIIGSTGSGKSTLLNLIPRFYDTTEGEILIDGIDIKDMTEEFLNNKIGYASQKAVLFKGTIESNIKLGKKNNKKVKEIDEALKIAKANEFVNKAPKKIHSDIAQGGTNISGGQKQRLSIARAIARDPEIYLFDDTFSALDYKTDYELRKKLSKKAKNATKVIVASRIGTIKDANQIIVLDNGEIVGIGKHQELLKKCKVYLEIAESQLSKEEIHNAW